MYRPAPGLRSIGVTGNLLCRLSGIVRLFAILLTPDSYIGSCQVFICLQEGGESVRYIESTTNNIKEENMSLNSMTMAETLPEKEILAAFEKLEDAQNSAIAHFAELIHYAYHRGCVVQHARCIAKYMVQNGCSYADARKVFDYPLVQGTHLKEEVVRYLSKSKGGDSR